MQDISKKNLELAKENNILKGRLMRYEKENVDLKRQLMEFKESQRSAETQLKDVLNQREAIKQAFDLISCNIQALMAISITSNLDQDNFEEQKRLFEMTDQEKEQRRRQSMDILTNRYREKAGDLSTILECSIHPSRPSALRLRMSSAGVSDAFSSVDMTIDFNQQPQAPQDLVEEPVAQETGRQDMTIEDRNKTPSPPPAFEYSIKTLSSMDRTPDVRSEGPEVSNSSVEVTPTTQEEEGVVAAKESKVKSQSKVKKTVPLKAPSNLKKKQPKPSDIPKIAVSLDTTEPVVGPSSSAKAGAPVRAKKTTTKKEASSDEVLNAVLSQHMKVVSTSNSSQTKESPKESPTNVLVPLTSSAEDSVSTVSMHVKKKTKSRKPVMVHDETSGDEVAVSKRPSRAAKKSLKYFDSPIEDSPLPKKQSKSRVKSAFKI